MGDRKGAGQEFEGDNVDETKGVGFLVLKKWIGNIFDERSDRECGPRLNKCPKLVL